MPEPPQTIATLDARCTSLEAADVSQLARIAVLETATPTATTLQTQLATLQTQLATLQAQLTAEQVRSAADKAEIAAHELADHGGA